MPTTKKPKKAAAESGTLALAPAPAPLGDDGELRRIPVAAIVPSPYQPRRVFDEAKLRELADSLAAEGLIQPITVRPAPDPEIRNGFELIAGERRWRAARLLGWDTIPAIVKSPSDAGAAIAAAVENLQRADLTPLEEAQAYRRLMKEHKLSAQKLAERLGVPRSTIGDRLALLDIGPWLELLAAGEITVMQALRLRAVRAASLADHQAAIEKARGYATRGEESLADIELRAWPWRLKEWYNHALYVLTSRWDRPAFDVSAHDAECACGRVTLTRDDQDHTEYCINPAWWHPRLQAANEAKQQTARAGGASGGSPAAAPRITGAPRALRADVVLQLPDNHADPVERRDYLLARDVVALTDADGRWHLHNGVGAFDPADLVLANEDLLEIADHYEGARRVGTTNRAAVEAAAAKWEARWEAREAELRVGEASLDCTLRGAGVRPLLGWFMQSEDDLFSEAVRECAAGANIAIPSEVETEVGPEADSYPSEELTGAWLGTLPLAVVEHIASTYLARERAAGRGARSDPVNKQLRAEQAAAERAIEARPVPWVIARPAQLGEQQDLVEMIEDEQQGQQGQAPSAAFDPEVWVWPADRLKFAGDAPKPGKCLTCGCSDAKACEPNGCAWAAYAPAAQVGCCDACATGEEAESIVRDHLELAQRAQAAA